MIVVKVKEAMERYRYRTGERLTYEKLAQRTGLAKPTIVAISSRLDYNTTLATIEKTLPCSGSAPPGICWSCCQSPQQAASDHNR